MARNVSLNTQKQNFLREAYYKEAMTRVKWHEKYYHDVAHFNKLCDPTEEEKRKTRIKRLQEAVPKFPKGKVIPVIDYPPKGMSRKEELEEDERYKEEIDEDLCDMRPVSPDTKKLLFDGFTKEEKGRYQYLLARKQIPPENKFEFPITSSWELGWRQKESISEFAAPTHGRNKIVRDTFYRKNGVFNAPIPMSMIKS